MAKIRLTKNELKKQKDELRRFQRYLPTLQLKKQQLQMVIQRVEREMQQLIDQQQEKREALHKWIAVFGENRSFPESRRVQDLVAVTHVYRKQGNIAGVPIPVFDGIEFESASYDLLAYPIWVDHAVEVLKELAELEAKIDTLKEQIDLLKKELRTTSQRVNLFEKIKIPEAQSNIRKIRIYLGDQQTAEVVRGKISKNKIMRASE